MYKQVGGEGCSAQGEEIRYPSPFHILEDNEKIPVLF